MLPQDAVGSEVTMPGEIDFVFFDIGGTFGERNASKRQFRSLSEQRWIIEGMRDPGLRIGIITTLGTFSNAEGLDLLKSAGLGQFLDPVGFISDHDAKSAKPNLEIYRFATKPRPLLTRICLKPYSPWLSG